MIAIEFDLCVFVVNNRVNKSKWWCYSIFIFVV